MVTLLQDLDGIFLCFKSAGFPFQNEIPIPPSPLRMPNWQKSAKIASVQLLKDMRGSAHVPKMDEKIKKRLRQLREEYGIPTAEKGVPLFQPGIDESFVANVYPSNDIRALGFKSAADNLINIA